eukprot:scaffold22268_cov123-Isochrysis_galbana.AAC.5
MVDCETRRALSQLLTWTDGPDEACRGHRRPARRGDDGGGRQHSRWRVRQSRQAPRATSPARSAQPSRGQREAAAAYRRRGAASSSSTAGRAARPAGDTGCNRERQRPKDCQGDDSKGAHHSLFDWPCLPAPESRPCPSLPTIPAVTPMPVALAGHRRREATPRQ